ncbi:MAG TPA: hypothetical protein VMB46_09570 [Methanomassiliicoccales archaeon]|nr:hypothetical protein [Methanomassiliicoccales archaeon]
MKATYIGIMALAVVAVMLTAAMGGAVSAASAPSSADRIRLETGHTNEWNGGDYVAINMTDGVNFAWFGVIYGTQEHPAPITLVSTTLRYLGGAEVVGPNGNTIANQVPIPILTAFGQSLFALLEFDDVGYNVPLLGNYGAGNGLFDFSGPNLWSGVGSSEPVYKYVDLNRSWTLSPITEHDSGVNKSFEFSLYALNVTYAKVWDPVAKSYRAGTPSDGVVEKIEFRFHIDATQETVTAAVPFYRVTVNDGHVVGSEQIAPRNFTANHVDCGIKYDHIIEGWDPYPGAVSPRLMLENVVAFGVFIPKAVEEWYNAQFVNQHIPNAAHIDYVTANGSAEVADQGQLPAKSIKLLSNTQISSMDNWARVGSLTWVSNVTVDGKNESMYYQIQAGGKDILKGENGGKVRALLILGGFIYPMGTNITHDPQFTGEAFQLNLNEGLKALFFVLIVGVVFIAACMITALFLIRRQNRRTNEKFDYRPPPGFR